MNNNPELEEPELAKSVATRAMNTRVLSVCSALTSLEKSFDPAKHPHGFHGQWARTHHAQHDDPGSGSPSPDDGDPTRRTIQVTARASVPSAEEILLHEGTERLESWFREKDAQKTPEEMARTLVAVLPDAGIGPIRRATPKFQEWLTVWNNSRMGEKSIPDELYGLHMAAADVFDAPLRLNLAKRPGAVALYETQGKGMRAFIHAMYTWTQQELARRGIEDAVLWRGLKGDRERRLGSVEGLQKAFMENYPVAAFSIEYGVASGFSGPAQGALLVAKVPAARLFATPLTGIGVWIQREALMASGERDLCYQAIWGDPEAANRYRDVSLREWVKLIQEQERKHDMEKSLASHSKSSPEAQNAAVRRMNGDERNIFGGTAPVSQAQLDRDRAERMRLHEELFGKGR